MHSWVFGRTGAVAGRGEGSMGEWGVEATLEPALWQTYSEPGIRGLRVAWAGEWANHEALSVPQM